LAAKQVGQQQRLVGRVAAMRQDRAARPAKDAGIGLEPDARGNRPVATAEKAPSRSSA
jgi:hypothetical protein